MKRVTVHHLSDKDTNKQRSPEEIDADIAELEKFILDIDCLDPLDKWVNRLNIFNILNIENAEIRHSNFLAWLFDPNETHGLGDYFLKKIIQNVINSHPLENRPISIFELDQLELDDAIVLRERDNIDLLILSKNAKLAFIIENKIDSGEHDNQLRRYEKTVNMKCPDYRKVFTYLTPYGDTPSENGWVSLSYEYIHTVIKLILENRELSNRCRVYLEDYLNILGDILMNDEDLKRICKEIIEKHGRAIEILAENAPTRQSVLDERITALLKPYIDSGKIKMLKSTYSEIRFTTNTIRDKVGLYGDNTWVDSGDLLVFYIPISNTDNRYMVMTLGPGDKERREMWFEYLKCTKLFACHSKKLTPQWKDVATYRIKDNDLEDETFIETFVESVKKFLDNLGEVERIISDGPDNL